LASRPRHTRLIDVIPTADLADVQGGWDPGMADDRPRILAYSQTTLSHDYRAASPLRALRDAGLARTLLYGRRDTNAVSCLSSREIEQLAPDASYWNFIVDDLRFEQGLQRCARDFPDLLRVYGLDDRIGDLPGSHPQAARFAGPQLDRRVREALALCHRLIVTTPALAELYGPLVDAVHIIPNRLEKSLWNNIAPPQRRENRRRPRVGWAGAPQHQGDLAVINEVVAELAGEVDWVFFGMLPPGCETHVREFHPPVPFTAYPEKLAALDLDIAIAPLEINLFNEAKSNLRLLDYGFLGLPVVCTDIAPYRDGNPPVIRVANTPAAWRNAIRALVANPAERTRLGQALRQCVCADYLLEEHPAYWLAALRPGENA
jgi:glycosyltransferase involved in cell wall biosynthesis